MSPLMDSLIIWVRFMMRPIENEFLSILVPVDLDL